MGMPASNPLKDVKWIEDPMLQLLLFPLLAVAAGASVAFQQVLNTNLRTALSSAAWSGVTSYAVGLASMLVLTLVLRDPLPQAALAARVPWWGYSGGFFGALFVAVAILLVPKLGAATFIVLLVSGQMLASVLFDHFGIMGLPERPIDLARAAGLVMLVGGCILIRH